MPPLSFSTARKAEYAVLYLALPGRPQVSAGVLLLDPERDQLHVRLRETWDQLADPEDVEILTLLEEDFKLRSNELGGAKFLEFVEDTFSNTLQTGGREKIAVGDFERALARLYERNVEGAPAAPVTIPTTASKLPLYSLRAAAGKFGEDMEGEPEGWVAALEGMRLNTDLFAIHIVGRSMEPRIPDGSLCVFETYRGGSRQGKWMLVWNRGASAGGGEFTIKRYTSRKAVSEDGEWRHEEIRLEPLNPEYEDLVLNPGEDYRTIAEFVRVVPYEEL